VSSKGERTRVAILSSTWELLRSRGAANIRMEDVAAEAGLSRQAVYLHFRSRTELMLALVEHIGLELGAAELFEPAENKPTAREALYASVAASARFQARANQVVMALDLARHTDEAAAAAWDERMIQRRKSIQRIVNRLKREGELRDEWKVRKVVDAISVLTAPRMYADLVVEHGFTLDEYERLTVACVAQFLRDPGEPR
jgi:AcrR family transcriptional regulator